MHPFPCSAWLCSASAHLHEPIHGVPAYAATVSKHTYSWCSAFVPPGASSGPSGKQGIGGYIIPFPRTFFFWDAPVCSSYPGPPQLSKKKSEKLNDYLTFFMFVLLTSICQYISEIVLFC